MMRTSFGLCKRNSFAFATESEGASFLKMVEQYFDKAGALTNIKPDRLNFYKRADNVVKFNLSLTRGKCYLIQMTEVSKLFLPTDVNIKLTNFQLKEEPDMPKMSIFMKLKL